MVDVVIHLAIDRGCDEKNVKKRAAAFIGRNLPQKDRNFVL
jgi:hypothetical protein